MYPIVRAILLISTTVILISCASGEQSANEIHTAQLPEIELNHLFMLEEPEGIFFERIRFLQTDSKGRIFVADQETNHILVYDETGDFNTTIGREGAGPDEFRAILNMFVDENDQLIIFDMANNRSVFFREVNGSWQPEEFVTIEGTRFGVQTIDKAGNYILRQSRNQMPDPGAYWYVHVLGTGSLQEGLLDDDVVEFREMGYLVRDDGLMNTIPFGRTTLLARGHDGKLYMTWNEDFEVAVYNAKLEPADSVRAAIPNQPITTEERWERLDRLDQFRSLAAEHMPDTKPVAEAMWVDRQQNIWLQTHDSPEYLVLDSNGEPIGSFDLEGERRILHVNGGRIYTLLSDDEGYVLDVYEVRL
ncbi:6-bladed beta-propeller [Rhodohalobacter halophilus]|uniref:6-bladed beta-propeller n=1 Tax=Rhodohalobacter halophilus TaxID=1812810 RepID=UPI00083F57ED|nr:6-bladed beta-propeller [Rhodohalobacter halophilus]